MLIESIKRRFLHNDKELTDPGSDLDPKGVRDFYAQGIPELTNASIDGPEIKEENGETVAVYTFNRKVGEKG